MAADPRVGLKHRLMKQQQELMMQQRAEDDRAQHALLGFCELPL